jgi:hypothetical protein
LIYYHKLELDGVSDEEKFKCPVCNSTSKDEFLAFQGYPGAPVTTNLIECFNSHLEARIKALHHFNSFEHAKLWLNRYTLRRRFTKFTDCKGKFKHLNGEISLNMSRKPDVDLPRLF